MDINISLLRGRQSIFHLNGIGISCRERGLVDAIVAFGLFLGGVHDTLTDTDISLLRLFPSQSFINETVGARFTDGSIVLPPKILGIRNAFELKSHDSIALQEFLLGLL
jgi:hypothetical protein